MTAHDQSDTAVSHTLVLVRHAKAESGGDIDRERPLTPEGRERAEKLAAWLSRKIDTPSIIYYSPALRAEETARAIKFRYPASRYMVEPVLYHGDYVGSMEFVRSLREHLTTVVIVGHEPIMSAVAMLLQNGDKVEQARKVMVGMPTGTACIIDINVPWSDVTEGSGTFRTLKTVR